MSVYQPAGAVPRLGAHVHISMLSAVPVLQATRPPPPPT